LPEPLLEAAAVGAAAAVAARARPLAGLGAERRVSLGSSRASSASLRSDAEPSKVQVRAASAADLAAAF
jgi:hypothetical protein